MTRWVLFDVGNVLLVDEPYLLRVWEELYHTARARGHAITFEELMAQRERLVDRQQDSAPHATVATELLGERGWAHLRNRLDAQYRQDYLACSFVLEGIENVLAGLSASYGLAVAANQPVACRRALETVGLRHYFDVVGLSEERGLSKPSLLFFEALLREAGCTPAEAIMIGDRVDNDIAPAQKLGMRTIWFHLGPDELGYLPKTRFEKIYIDSLRRIPSRGTGCPRQRIEPDVAVTSLDHLLDAVEKIART